MGDKDLLHCLHVVGAAALQDPALPPGQRLQLKVLLDLIWRPCSRLVLVVGKDKERQCAELRVLQGRVELITCCLKVLI